ncbi:hypothetical protein [Caballeronia sp. RCC_10]|jgi:hypothetical protein|uniref:hypothetical protein n=1 Tax=Caballeronia sp. RCC_10 TaxID=3239227 RepID=UPI0035256A80
MKTVAPATRHPIRVALMKVSQTSRKTGAAITVCFEIIKTRNINELNEGKRETLDQERSFVNLNMFLAVKRLQ